MTDDRFDRELRGFLAAREPASVSPVLRARLQTVTAESPARAGAFAGRLGGAWRAGVGLAAAVAVAVVLLALLVRVDASTIRDPGPGRATHGGARRGPPVRHGPGRGLHAGRGGRSGATARGGLCRDRAGGAASSSSRSKAGPSWPPRLAGRAPSTPTATPTATSSP